MSAAERIKARHREATTCTVVIDPATGAWSLQAVDGSVVATGKWTKGGARRTIRVQLAYDPSAYFDALVDRKRALDRADKLRAALENVERAESLAVATGTAHEALNTPFELAVREEQRTDEEGSSPPEDLPSNRCPPGSARRLSREEALAFLNTGAKDRRWNASILRGARHAVRSGSSWCCEEHYGAELDFMQGAASAATPRARGKAPR